jgi:hypothetical protein
LLGVLPDFNVGTMVALPLMMLTLVLMLLVRDAIAIALVSNGLSGSAFAPSIQRMCSVGTVKNDGGPHVVSVEVLGLERRLLLCR